MAGPLTAGRIAGGIALALAVMVLAQELRWQMHQPFELSGISHAVGIPVGQPLTAGYSLRNRSSLPVTLEAISVLGDRHTRGLTETLRLDVTDVAVTTGSQPVPAKPGTAFDRGLTARPIDGAVVEPGADIALVVTYVGTGPHSFRAGPISVEYSFAGLRGTQDIPLSRGYRIRVTSAEPDQ